MSHNYLPSSHIPEEDSDGGNSSDSYSPRDIKHDAPTEITVTSRNQYVSSEVAELSASPDSSDNEYRVEPQADLTTPVYAPSRPASDSEDEIEEPPPPPQYHQSAHEILDSYAVEGDVDKDARAEEHSDGELDDNKLEHFNKEQPDEVDVEEFDGFDVAEEGTKGIIADIFGESDAEEEEEFEGFAENEVEKEAPAISRAGDVDDVRRHRPHQRHHQQPELTETGNVEEGESGDEFVSDFERIMNRRREETRRNRRAGRDEFLNDNDDIISETIFRMRASADEDRNLISTNKPATKKLAMLKIVDSLLTKADMKPALLDNGILSAITDWLSPLPGQILPSVTIRDTLLRHLSEFSIKDPELLRESGIGKAVMYLYKHPKETRDNKKRAGHLINEWSRPIFNLTSDYRTLSKEERKQLDYDHLPKRRNYDNEELSNRDINREIVEQPGATRPGAPGWVNRARVPQPSNRDYVIRPKWNISATHGNDEDDDDEDEEGDQGGGEQRAKRRRIQIPRVIRKSAVASSGSGIGSSTRIETHIRNLAKNAASRKKSRFVRAVPMSIEGRKMSL